MSAPAFGWVDLDDTRTYCQSLLAKPAPETLKPHWDVLITKSLVRAYWTIVTAFIKRGYTKAQVDQWDRGAEFQSDLAAFDVLRQMAVLHPYITSQNQLDMLDRRKELVAEADTKDVVMAVLSINGDIAESEGEFGSVHAGGYDTTEDMFVMPTDDSRIGQTTRL